MRRTSVRPRSGYSRLSVQCLEARDVPSDGFEQPEISSFWEVEQQQSGTFATSTDRAHSGNQSLKLQSTQTGANKYLYLAHTFPAPIFGKASIWVYDTGADIASSNYLSFSVGNSVTGKYNLILTFDYDLGPGRGGDVYYYHFWNAAPNPGFRSPIDRTQGWHLWEFNSTPDSQTITVDNQVVYTGSSGLAFDQIRIGMSGPNWRPAFTGYFDDFSVREHGNPDIEAKSLAWSTDQGGVDFGYANDRDLLQPASAVLKWSADLTLDPSDTLAWSGPLSQAEGNHGPIHVAAADLAPAPAGARYLLLDLDSANQVDESDETNNRLALAIPNRDPVVDVGSDQSTVRGGPVSITGSFADPDADAWTATVDYGDGTGVQPLTLNPDKTFALDHTYTDAGSYTVTVAVTDSEGSVGADTTRVTVNAVAVQVNPVDPDETDLIIGGTTRNDIIVVTRARPGLTVRINGARVGTFAPTDRIVVYGQAGNDNIEVGAGVTTPAWLYGGPGNDRLKAGGGSAVLVGGAGDDRLVGGKSRDLVIGGSGADRLIGYGADDLLIAGLTLYETNTSALGAIQEEWTRTDKAHAERVANLQNGTGLNGPVVLNATTVSDDASQDVLTGNAGADWSLFDITRDRVTDQRAGTL